MTPARDTLGRFAPGSPSVVLRKRNEAIEAHRIRNRAEWDRQRAERSESVALERVALLMAG